jgi:phospholipid/cholesterol/gamma-HCH transport system permease protein
MAIFPGLQEVLQEIGSLASFGGRYFREMFRRPFEWHEFIRQCYEIGYRSFSLVALTAFIMGLVITMQLRPSMVYYGVESQIPAMVGVAIIREIAPVITALIFAGKIGSSIGAELGSMRVTEQIDAMEVSGTNPFRYLVVTRTLAATLMMPLLAVMSTGISLYGSFLGVNLYEVLSWKLFIHQVFDSLEYMDVVPAFIKCFFFGMAVGMVGCFKGYYSSKGTEGVGRSANSAVVMSSILIFIIDLVAVQVAEIIW